MWEHSDSAAIDGLRYLTFLGSAARPSADAFGAYLEHPRPIRKTLTDAVQASKGPGGKDLFEWMVRIGWVDDSDDVVTPTALGLGVLAAVDARPGSGSENDTEDPTADIEEVDEVEEVEEVDDLDGDGTLADDDEGLIAV